MGFLVTVLILAGAALGSVGVVLPFSAGVMGNALAVLLPITAAAFLLVLVWHANAPAPAASPRHAAEGEAEGTGAPPRHLRAEDAQS